MITKLNLIGIKILIGTTVSVNTSESSNVEFKASLGKSEETVKMECVHVQRIPTNTKVVIVADVDRDGANEMIIGLTDRVVRSYRWSNDADLGTGKLIGLNKWECANQIGTLTMQDDSDGIPALLVAQPGGTFMRIKCSAEDSRSENTDFDTSTNEEATSSVDYQRLGISRMRNPNISTEILGNLNPKVNNVTSNNSPKLMAGNDVNKLNFSNTFRDDCTDLDIVNANFSSGIDSIDGNLVGGNIIVEARKISENEICDPVEHLCEKVDSIYSESLAQQSNLELKNKKDNNMWSNSKSYALATLDGTIMLVKDEIILW